ncbi:hypothetical protein D0510_06735 [Weissella confusa]|uniref:Uncharacterized protein n=1 Tax=Weissella confusa TaxID=1583 RepID=A0A923SN53_WEICO|nr:hypothetical protein [Weissella confusa]MBA5934074.1 hypothetical protein [Weissella confusa]MBC6498786.1 hypothetical protein [Weissella confusa]MBF7057217.1 hypothetical protein [Weissella confusa]MCT8397066.1 hypothetical protein [Weissella confusa]UYY89909.1 hypothetical protein OLB07_09120 [Weissella confusa]
MTIFPENTGLLADIFMDRFGDNFLYVQTKHYKQFVMLEDGVWFEDAHGEFHKHVIELSHIVAQIIELHVPDAPVFNTGADVKIMDRFFRHREVPDSENFSKPGFQLKKASFLGVFVGRTGPRPAGERKQVV